MENITIISKEEYIKRADEIITAKKLKTRAGDFDSIKAASYVKVEPVVEEQPFMPKEEITPVEPEVEVKEEIKEESKDEDITFAYGLRKPEEDIAFEDITRIKNIGDTYKGGNPKEDFKKVEVAKKEEKKEEPKLTKEEYEKDLNVEAYSERIATYKGKVRDGYNAILTKISEEEKRLEAILNDYANATKTGTMLQEKKKQLQNILKGINSWDLECLAPIKDREDAKTLISYTGGVFENVRQELNQTIQEEKNNDAYKEKLGKSEQQSRESIAAYKKEEQEYMEKTHPGIKEANRTDAELKETDERITELTGIEAEEPKLNMVEPQSQAFEPERTRVTDVRNLNEPIQFVDSGMIQNGMGQGRAA